MVCQTGYCLGLENVTMVYLETRPEVSEADPGIQKVTQSKVSKLRPAHRNSEVNMYAQPSIVKTGEPMSKECLK